jgi:predicted lipid carrier protein YhbT
MLGMSLYLITPTKDRLSKDHPEHVPLDTLPPPLFSVAFEKLHHAQFHSAFLLGEGSKLGGKWKVRMVEMMGGYKDFEKAV